MPSVHLTGAMALSLNCALCLGLASSELVLKDVDHGASSGLQSNLKPTSFSVLFMQENRAFDHVLLGTMAGVRGFADPNVYIAQNGNPVWFQKGNLSEATQCMVAGWTANHNAFANGDNNLWALDNTPFSLGYYKRQDLPTHFGIAEDGLSPTCPTLDQGGVTVDNNQTPGCEAPNISCFPMNWKTFPEFLEDANVTWQVFQTAPNGSALAQKAFLPQVSYIIGPAELSEHPPFAPHDGAWLQQQVVNAVIKSPKYSSTVLMIPTIIKSARGEHGPFQPGPTVPVFSGPGFRLPFYVISPWTQFLVPLFVTVSNFAWWLIFAQEQAGLKGKNVVTNQLNSWRPNICTAECQAMFPDPEPPIPTILVFESNGDALALSWVAPAVPSHDAPTHRFILHATAPPPATTFNIHAFGPNNKEATLINNAAVFNITDLGSGKGYTVQQTSVLLGDHRQTFNIFSVTTSADSGQGFLDELALSH
ncbi:hypothetical protein JB92DRAFT_2886613 [Gautieria morchelliformis]|nr:hypothetical protein JB92DRAFT_2886613 [Gautieria morchelliformis]